MKPKRIQLSRKKGWRMPPNTVKVDRSTRWGNPFIVGKHGNRMGCLQLFNRLCGGRLCISMDLECLKKQMKFHGNDFKQLKNKNLACWCKENELCHADILLKIANET